MDVGVFVVDDVADFGLAAVLEVLSTAQSLREEIDTPPQPWRISTLGLGGHVRTGAGHTVPTTPLDSVAGLPDLLIVPAVNVKQSGALIELVSCPQNRPVLELIARAHAERVELAAACTGTFFLGEAGVLDGSAATTSWWLAPVFRHRYPLVTLEEGHTLRRAPGITTAGAAFSHVDLALSLIQAQSPALADLVARYLLIGGTSPQAAFAVPSAMAQHDPLTASFERWVRQHLDQPIKISAAAGDLGVSERSLQRATAAALGMSPMDFINEVRLDRATYLIRSTNATAESVAAQVGFLNVGTLRDLIRRRRGMTIRELRRGRVSPALATGGPDRAL
ncbi:MAG: GlxA family transcriptional regulator [Sporichthyaceae bacterium]